MVNPFGMMGGWAAGLAFGITSSIVMIPVSALFLWLTTKIFKTKDTSFTSALIVAAILGGANLVFSFFTSIPFVGWLFSILSFFVMICLSIFLVKWKYSIDWGKAILIWLVWFVLAGFVLGILAAIVAIFATVLGLGAGMLGGMIDMMG